MSCDCPNQGKFDWPCAFTGRSFSGFEITISEDEVELPALAAATIEFKVDLQSGEAPALVLSVGSGLTIVSAASPWVIGVDDIETVPLAPGIYFYDLKTTDSNGFKDAFLAGTWTINPTT